MDEALVLVDNGQYWAAVSKYLEAVGLHGEIFRDDYPEDIIKETDSVIADVKAEFKQIISGKNEYVLNRENSFVSSEKDYYDGLKNEYAPLISLISNMAEIRKRAVLHAVYFDSKKTELLKEGEYDIPFLTTINRTITGRKSSEREEGLLYAVDSIWNSSIDPNLSILTDNYSEYYSSGVEKFDSGEFFTAADDFRKASGTAAIRKEFLSLWSYAVNPKSSSGLSKRDILKSVKYIPEYMLAEKENKAAFDYAVLSELMADADRIEKNYPSVEDKDVLIGYREDIIRDRSVIDINRDAWNEIYYSTKSMEGGSLDINESVNLSLDMNKLFSKYSSYLSALEVDLVRGRFDLIYEPLNSALLGEEESVNRAVDMIDGVNETVGEGENTYTGIVKYPELALPMLRSSLGKLNQYNSEYDTLRSLLSGENTELKDSPDLKESGELISTDKTLISDLKYKIGVYNVKAEELLTQAEIYSTQGYKRLDEAKSRLRQNRFTDARNRLQDARESFRLSFKF